MLETSSRLIRCIMKELTQHLEERFCEERAYVLWGAYEDLPQYEEHEFSIHGTVCGHIPSISLRGDILGPSSANEWVFNGEEYLHRSGLTSISNVADKIDKTAFHPLTISSEVESLLSQLRAQHAFLQIRSKATPLLRWAGRNTDLKTPLTPQQQPESQLVHLARRVR